MTTNFAPVLTGGCEDAVVRVVVVVVALSSVVSDVVVAPAAGLVPLFDLPSSTRAAITAPPRRRMTLTTAAMIGTWLRCAGCADGMGPDGGCADGMGPDGGCHGGVPPGPDAPGGWYGGRLVGGGVIIPGMVAAVLRDRIVSAWSWSRVASASCAAVARSPAVA